MNDKRGSPLIVWLVAVALLLGTGGGYTAAYFALTQRITRDIHTGVRCRIYQSLAVAVLFVPASLVESAVSGEIVSPACP